MLIDVVRFFSDHVAGDLQAPLGSIHPILQVDAIRFVHMFRNQVSLLALLGSQSTEIGPVYKRPAAACVKAPGTPSWIGELCVFGVCGDRDRTGVVYEAEREACVSPWVWKLGV
jgi:hypothetical protein